MMPGSVGHVGFCVLSIIAPVPVAALASKRPRDADWDRNSGVQLAPGS
jgi:hypothetical protein